MRAYLVLTGIIFGLITVAHGLRIILENPHLATDPVFLLLTMPSAALCIWAGRLLWLSKRSAS